MASKAITGVEIRLFSPLSSLKNPSEDRRVAQFKAEYVLKFDDSSEARVAGNPARQSKVFNTPEFTRCITDALSEFARNTKSGTWHARDEPA
jgi:hypothetical protein